jgi:hypothetical protein
MCISFVRDRKYRRPCKYETFGSDNVRDIKKVELLFVKFISLW